jgi:hypothetical protein
MDLICKYKDSLTQLANKLPGGIPLPTVKDLSIEIDCELGGKFIPSI